MPLFNQFLKNDKFLNDKKMFIPHSIKVTCISQRVRSRIRGKTRMKYISKKYMESLLGCSINEYICYLEDNFQEGMTWENREFWSIDHIIPLSRYDISNKRDIKKAFNYKNTQLLWVPEDNNKNNRMNHKEMRLNILKDINEDNLARKDIFIKKNLDNNLYYEIGSVSNISEIYVRVLEYNNKLLMSDIMNFLYRHKACIVKKSKYDLYLLHYKLVEKSFPTNYLDQDINFLLMENIKQLEKRSWNVFKRILKR